MSTLNITSRYAKALLEIAQEKNNLEQVSKDVESAFNTFKDSKELRQVMSSPVLRNDKKNEILKQIFSNKISHEVLTFLLFIVEKNREEFLYDVLKRYLEMNDALMGIVSADVISPVSMKNDQVNKLKIQLEKFTGKKVKINTRESKNLLGGFIVKIGDTVIDASVDHQLAMLKKKFLEDKSLATN